MKQFVEDAIAGGWKKNEKHILNTGYDLVLISEAMLLDPLAWKAVGKTRKWDANEEYFENAPNGYWYKERMHHFINHLINGLSIEEALKEIR